MDDFSEEPACREGYGKLQSIDSWVRNRLRLCIWSRLRREKKPDRKRKNLIRLGVPGGKAYAWSRSKKGRWAIAQSPILLTTITLERLQKRGYEMRNEFDLTILKRKRSRSIYARLLLQSSPALLFRYLSGLYTRPAWPALSKAKGYSGHAFTLLRQENVRGALRHNLVTEPPTHYHQWFFFLSCYFLLWCISLYFSFIIFSANAIICPSGSEK